MNRKRLATDSLLILALSVLLIAPLFKLEYLDNWSSIESTFISDARMLSENLPHPGWQPLWYTGTRFDYIYPPALRYGTTLISKAAGVSTARAYHVYTAFWYVTGMVAVYWLMLAGTRSRLGAWLASVSVALVSPCYLVLRDWRLDSSFGAPQRLHVLIRYGEGPHVTALCMLPAALAAMWVAVRERRPAMTALAGVLCALVVSNNFYGATALAMFTPLLVWAAWLGESDWRVPARAAGIALLAYGLCAFWLTPGYLGITLTNLRLVAEPGNTRSTVIFGAAIAVFLAASFWLARGKRELAWPVFTAGAAWVLGWYVLGHEFLGLQVAGNTVRLMPELDLAILLMLATALVWPWGTRNLRLALGGVLLLTLLPMASKYVKRAWLMYPELPSMAGQYPPGIANWIGTNLPGVRVLPSGEVRFWFNTWANLPQADGGSQQGMLNQILPMAYWQIQKGDKQEPSVLWLQALGVGAVVVPDSHSRDYYKGDYAVPEKFRGLPVLFDDGQGTVIYRIPQTYAGEGRVVRLSTLEGVGAIQTGIDTERLGKFVGEMEKPGREPVKVEWRGFDEVTLEAKAGEGEGLLLQQTFDPAWEAEENGARLTIRKDATMGFMLIPLAPGAHRIRMHFTMPLENRVGWALTALSALFVLGIWGNRYVTLRNNRQRVTSVEVPVS